jgi:hypothetical protein
MRRGVAAGAVIAAFLMLPASAAALADIGWPQLLPGRTDVPTSVQPHPVANCPAATIACVDDLLRRLQEQWEPLDAACDHRALWPLAYIRITQGLRDGLTGAAPPAFRYPDWFIYVITTFSNRYFEAYRNYEAGRPVPESWRITFDAAARGDYNGGQDILLASNAHTQRDLPFVYAEQGTLTPAGASRKHDHDAVNIVNNAVLDATEEEFAERYDPFYKLIDLPLAPLEEVGTLEVVKGWRELAWRNGERLLAAKTAAERAQVAGQIEANANLWAKLIASGGFPGYRERRDEYCRAR